MKLIRSQLKNISILFPLFVLILGFSIEIAWGQSLTFQPIYFKARSTKLDEASTDALNRIAKLMETHPKVTLNYDGMSGLRSHSSTWNINTHTHTHTHTRETNMEHPSSCEASGSLMVGMGI